MHAQIVIVVTRTFWRCAACRVLRKKSDSIDHHLKVCHSDFDSPRPCVLNISETSSFEKGILSGGETDSNVVKASIDSSHVPPERENQIDALSQDNAQSETVAAHMQHKETNRRKISKKQLKRVFKQQAQTTIDTLDVSKTNDGEDENVTSARAQDGDWSEQDKKQDKELNFAKNTARHLKSRSCRKHHASMSLHSTGKQKDPKKKTTKSGTVQCIRNKSTPQKSEKEGNSVSTEATLHTVTPESRLKFAIDQDAQRGRKRKAAPVVTLTKMGMDDELEASATNNQSAKLKKKSTLQDRTLPAKQQQIPTAKCCEKDSSTKHMKTTTQRVKNHVDKTKIATCCAPWLFDTSRKAGDRVNKKPRRLLLPEEKEAVKELYGTAAFTHADKFVEVHTQSSSSTGYALETRPVNLSESLPVMSIDLMSLASQNTNSRNLNMYALNARDFFSDPTRPQENMFTEYDAMYQHQNEQIAVQGPECNPIVHAAIGTMNSIGGCMHNRVNMIPPNTQPSTRNSTNYSSFCQNALGSNQGVTDLNQQEVNKSSDLRQIYGVSNQSQQTDSKSSTVSPSVHNIASVVMSESCSGVKGVPTVPTALTAQGDNTTNNKGGECHENQCSVCHKEFHSADCKQKHEQDTGNFEVVECKRCKQKIHGIHQLNVHVFSEHETEKEGFCFICSEDTEGLENLEKHVFRHAYNKECALTELKFHDCRICKEELQSEYSIIRTHYYQHHIAHVCGECFQHFDGGTCYTEHCKTHDSKVVYCSICGLVFCSAEELQSHLPCAQDMWAEDGKGAQCSKCNLWCPNKAVREAHRKQHRSQEDVEAYRKGAEKGFPCVSCEKVFKNKHACRRHIKMVHQGVSCYKHYCEYCGKGFLTKGHMRDHIALHHLFIKRYKCEYCDQQFVCAPTLRRHTRKEHTKHKPYECEHCGERFFEKTPLQRHLTTHTGLAPFMCEHCGKGFYTKHSFTNHGTTHSTTRDYVCKGCQKGFTRKYNLQTHTKICKLV